MRVFRYCVVLARRHQHSVSLLSAFLLSLGLWYFINVQGFLETQIEVNIDYTGTPTNLVVTDGLVHKATLRLRGPEALIRAAANEHPVNTVNLSGIKRGETVVPLVPEEIPRVYRAFEVVDLQPRQIVVKAENLIDRAVPVHLVLNSSLRGNAITVKDGTVNPAFVNLRGPESVVKGLSRISVPVTIDPTAKGEVLLRNITLNPPRLVTAQPQTVEVSYTITSDRSPVSRKYRVELSSSSSKDYEISPSEITLWVDIPDALANNTKYFEQVKITAIPPNLDPGESDMAKINYSLPEGMVFLDMNVDEVRITRKKTQADKD